MQHVWGRGEVYKVIWWEHLREREAWKIQTSMGEQF